MDAQIAYKQQAEEQAKEQYESVQPAKQVDIDCKVTQPLPQIGSI